MSLNDILEKRGILDAAKQAGWFDFQWRHSSGWAYPVYDLMTGRPVYTETARTCLHWKNAAPSGPKYGFPFGAPVRNAYYGPKDLRAQIKANAGLVYLASGSPDVLAYQSVGLPALAWFNGEVSVPATLADDLVRLGVQQVIYCPDLDFTGEASARKVAGLLTGRLPLAVRKLPGAALGQSGDINQLWQFCRFDAELFRSTVDNLPGLVMTATAITPHESNAGSPVACTVCPDCARNYFDRVFALELSALANAPDHDRNNQLNRSAFALGTLLGAGVGQRDEVERGLADVARLRGLSEYETTRTIRSGLEAGLRKPRVIQIGGDCPHRK